MFTDYHKWDEELIKSKTNEAKLYEGESKSFK